MATQRQELAVTAELLVVDTCRCLRCGGAFRPFRKSTPCADVSCIECGAPAKIQSRRWAPRDRLPRKLMGGEWGSQARLLLQDRLHDLFVVLVAERGSGLEPDPAIHVLPGDAQDSRLFRRRWVPALAARGEGFTYELEPFWPLFTKVEGAGARPAARPTQVVHAFPSQAQRKRLASARWTGPRSPAALLAPPLHAAASPATTANVVSLRR